MFTPCPDGGLNPLPLDCKSVALPTELCRPLSITLFKDVYELNDVSNDIYLNDNKFISHLNKVNYQTTSDKQKKKAQTIT